jgi:hypothetical protein
VYRGSLRVNAPRSSIINWPKPFPNQSHRIAQSPCKPGLERVCSLSSRGRGVWCRRRSALAPAPATHRARRRGTGRHRVASPEIGAPGPAEVWRPAVHHAPRHFAGLRACVRACVRAQRRSWYEIHTGRSSLGHHRRHRRTTMSPTDMPHMNALERPEPQKPAQTHWLCAPGMGPTLPHPLRLNISGQEQTLHR